MEIERLTETTFRTREPHVIERVSTLDDFEVWLADALAEKDIIEQKIASIRQAIADARQLGIKSQAEIAQAAVEILEENQSIDGIA